MIDIPRPDFRDNGEEMLCFGCSPQNPIGLKVEMTWDGQYVHGIFRPQVLHQGWPGFVHGGILMTVLDEVMANTGFLQGIHCVTATIQVKLKRPARLEDAISATAWVTRKTSRLLDTAGKLTTADGHLIAESTATFYITGIASPGDSARRQLPESDISGSK